MKTVNIILTLLTCVGLNAQTSDKVNLSIILRPVQSIVINPLQKDIELIYDTEDKYKDGVTSINLDHLKVFSSGGFAVQVASKTPFDGISLSDVSITAEAVKTNPNYTFNSVSLSQTETDLIVSNKGGRDILFNVTYQSNGDDKYLDKEYKKYSTEVEYTILPK